MRSTMEKTDMNNREVPCRGRVYWTITLMIGGMSVSLLVYGLYGLVNGDWKTFFGAAFIAALLWIFAELPQPAVVRRFLRWYARHYYFPEE